MDKRVGTPIQSTTIVVTRIRIQFLFVILQLNGPAHSILLVLVTKQRLGIQPFTKTPLLYLIAIKLTQRSYRIIIVLAITILEYPKEQIAQILPLPILIININILDIEQLKLELN